VVFGTAGNNHIIAAVVATEGLAFRTGRRAAKSLNIHFVVTLFRKFKISLKRSANGVCDVDLGVVLMGVYRFLGAGDFRHCYSIVYPVGRRVVDAKINNYLVVAVGTPSVLSCFHGGRRQPGEVGAEVRHRQLESSAARGSGRIACALGGGWD
jgi:hypothetical protein